MASKRTQRFMSEHIRRHRTRYKMPQKQAVAVAYSEARAKGMKVPAKHNPSFGWCFHHWRFEPVTAEGCICELTPPQVHALLDEMSEITQGELHSEERHR